MTGHEVNIDGLVGPTHNYAGLSLGNRASMSNAGAVSNPRAAALQGLAKMRALHRLGLRQGVMPPQQRPDPTVLVELGFSPDASVATVAQRHPELLPIVMSASSMWAANAATVTPSVDARDGRVHLTPANLSSTTHRSFEHRQTERTLRAMFPDRSMFEVHPALPAAAAFADEGAANHGRFAPRHGEAGIHFFVHGRTADEPVAADGGFPRRQTELASRLISDSHGHDPDRVIHVRQAARAIDAGAFHNDVVSVANGMVLFAHELAFEHREDVAQTLRARGVELVEVGDAEVPLADAIRSYLFNSQLLTLPNGSMALVAPIEVQETPSTAAYLEAALAEPDHPISELHVFDLRESMRNGGGPACLRLRVVLTDSELAAADRVLVDDDRLDQLEGWVDRHYRDALSVDDLADPEFEDQNRRALDELTQLLDLGSIYPFQL